MLNGVDPIMIFRFFNKSFTDTLGPLSGIAGAIGLPIPIYLSERWQSNVPAAQLPGIILSSTSRSIDVSTRVDAVTGKDEITKENKTPVVEQMVIDSSTTLSLFASKDSLIMGVLIALSEMIISKVATAEYAITFLSSSTIIFNGYLNRFSVSETSDDTLIRVEMVISNANKGTPTPKANPPFVANKINAITAGGK